MKANEQVIAESIDYLTAHYLEQPELDGLARRAGYELTHFQKLFQKKVGLTPKKLIQYLTFRHARDFLLNGHSTMEAAFSAGLSGQGRLHDLFVTCEAATPGEVQRRGQGLSIRWGYYPSSLGEMLIGLTDKGVCWLGFAVDENRSVPLEKMRAHWPLAEFVEDQKAAGAAGKKIIAIWAGKGDRNDKLKLNLYGTNFQIQVWQALLKIPCGGFVSYQDIADKIGKKKACRAVGSAVGANPVSLLIPCHRVIQKSGLVENYGWGTPRKKLLLALECNAFQEP